ncbi:MAG: hypothetical protein QOJ64_2870 [Acidobacteriota bacterium]|jgi:hypothetical protein|nr:hypothetical protein [Acidobacteriota bacterium]
MRKTVAFFVLVVVLAFSNGCDSGPPTNTTNTSATPEMTPAKTNVGKNIDEINNQLPTAKIDYNAPDTMNLEETTTIQLVLEPRGVTEEARKQIERVPGKRVTQENVKTTEEMEAQLTAADPSAFTITEITLVRQQIPQNEPTQWRWKVTPLKSGKQTLTLVLNVIYENHGKEQKRTLPTYEKTIDVSVGIRNRVTSVVTTAWDWIWKAMLIPALAALWLLIRRYFTKRSRLKGRPSEARAKAIIEEHLSSEYKKDPSTKLAFEYGSFNFGTPTESHFPKDDPNSGRTVYPVRALVSITVTRTLDGEESVEKIERGKGKETFYLYKDDFNQWGLDIKGN